MVEQELKQMPNSRKTISSATIRRGEAWGTEFMAAMGWGQARLKHHRPIIGVGLKGSGG
jgi:hypothetical protein